MSLNEKKKKKNPALFDGPILSSCFLIWPLMSFYFTGEVTNLSDSKQIQCWDINSAYISSTHYSLGCNLLSVHPLRKRLSRFQLSSLKAHSLTVTVSLHRIEYNRSVITRTTETALKRGKINFLGKSRLSKQTLLSKLIE